MHAGRKALLSRSLETEQALVVEPNPQPVHAGYYQCQSVSGKGLKLERKTTNVSNKNETGLGSSSHSYVGEIT